MVLRRVFLGNLAYRRFRGHVAYCNQVNWPLYLLCDQIRKKYMSHTKEVDKKQPEVPVCPSMEHNNRDGVRNVAQKIEMTFAVSVFEEKFRMPYRFFGQTRDGTSVFVAYFTIRRLHFG